MPFPPSAACRFFDLPPVNLQNLPLHLTKNSFASAPTHLCGIAYIFHHPLPGMVSLLLRKMERKPDWLSDFPVQIYCNRRRGVAAKPPQVTVSRPSDTRRWLSDRPRHPFGPLIFKLGRDPTLVGRGGSVSRRDHNQAYRRRIHSQAEPSKRKGATQTPAALRERGSGGEALLSEKRPLPQNFRYSSLREGARGRGLLFREAASLAYLVSPSHKLW